jgi:hypothetical protein
MRLNRIETVDAIQWTGKNLEEVLSFLKAKCKFSDAHTLYHKVETIEKTRSINSWLEVKAVHTEYNSVLGPFGDKPLRVEQDYYIVHHLQKNILFTMSKETLFADFEEELK